MVFEPFQTFFLCFVVQFGEDPKVSFTPKDHVELALALDIVDFDSAAEVRAQCQGGKSSSATQFSKPYMAHSCRTRNERSHRQDL